MEIKEPKFNIGDIVKSTNSAFKGRVVERIYQDSTQTWSYTLNYLDNSGITFDFEANLELAGVSRSELLKEIRHELATLDDLWATDKPSLTLNEFQISTSALLDKIDRLVEL